MKTKIIISTLFLMFFAFGTQAQNNQKKTDPYRYNFAGDQLKLKKTYLTFGTIYNTQVQSKSTEIFNNTDKPMTLSFSGIPKLPAYLEVSVEPKVIPAKTKGTLTIKYTAKENKTAQGKQKWGHQNSRIYVAINGAAVDRKNSISIRANIQEDFKSMTPKQLANAPKIVFDEKTYDFGKVNQGENVVHEFVFRNTGKRDLEIRKVKGS